MEVKMRRIFRLQWTGVARRLRRDFLAGILVVVPIAATILILKWLFDSIDGILQPAVEAVFGRSIPGIGFAAIIILIYLAGLIGTNLIGKRIIKRGESLITDMPMIREIYKTFKQVMESVMKPHKGGFKEVVLVEWPKAGMKTIGFVTNRVKDRSGKEYLSVYIPTTPNPTSGYLEIMPVDDATRIDMSIEDAIKMVISGGMISPEVIDSLT